MDCNSAFYLAVSCTELGTFQCTVGQLFKSGKKQHTKEKAFQDAPQFMHIRDIYHKRSVKVAFLCQYKNTVQSENVQKALQCIQALCA